MNKDVLLVIRLLIMAGAVSVAVFSIEKQHKLLKNLEEEKYSRMVAEDSSQKSAAKLATLENQMKSTQEKMAKLKDILDQEKEFNQDLKDQYEKLVRAKVDLELKLKTTMEEKSTAAQQTAQQVTVVPAATVPVAGAQ